MFEVMARRNNIAIQPDGLTLDQRHIELSGANIESVVLTARRRALLEQRPKVTSSDIEQSLAEFIPSVQGLKKNLQEIAAVLECTQLDFLSESWRKTVDAPEGRSKLQQQLTRTRAGGESVSHSVLSRMIGGMSAYSLLRRRSA